MARYDDLNTRQIWAVGIVSAALTVVTVLAVQVLYYALLDRHNDVNLAGSEFTQSNQYLVNQASELQRYGKDQETGAVHIPIDRAMRLVIERSATGTNSSPDAANGAANDAANGAGDRQGDEPANPANDAAESTPEPDVNPAAEAAAGAASGQAEAEPPASAESEAEPEPAADAGPETEAGSDAELDTEADEAPSNSEPEAQTGSNDEQQ